MTADRDAHERECSLARVWVDAGQNLAYAIFELRPSHDQIEGLRSCRVVMRVELHVEIERLQDRDEKSRRDPMAGPVMCLGRHPMPLFLPNVSLEKAVKRQPYFVKQHAETAPIPGRQLRIVIADEDA